MKAVLAHLRQDIITEFLWQDLGKVEGNWSVHVVTLFQEST